MPLSFDLRTLNVFLAVVAHGGFSAAARELHVAQSAVSQTIANLERRLVREEMVVCVPREHPFATRESVSPAAFFGETLVLFQDGYFHREFVDALARETGAEADIAFQSNLIPLTKAIVRQGFGITTFLRRVVEEPELVAVPFAPPTWLDLSVAWARGAYLSRAEKAFVDYVLANRGAL